MTFPSGKVISNTYTNGLLRDIQTPEGITTFDYGCSNKVSGITKGTETMSFAYDGSLVTSVSNSGILNQTVGYSYNNDFRLNTITYAGTAENLVYDDDGLLTTAGSFTITRNAQNGLPETVSDSILSLNRSFSGYGEIDGNTFTIGGIDAYSWNITERDLAGRITQRIENVGLTTITWDYRYDDIGRLLEVQKDSVVVESYTYDANGNREAEMKEVAGLVWTGRSEL